LAPAQNKEILQIPKFRKIWIFFLIKEYAINFLDHPVNWVLILKISFSQCGAGLPAGNVAATTNISIELIEFETSSDPIECGATSRIN
jgi:hypothetical protein